MSSVWPVRVDGIPVAWGDMDAFQHVNNTVYLKWFETARIAYFDALLARGIDEVGSVSEVGPILAHTAVNFRIPVTYPDTVAVEARVPKLGNSSFTMEYRVKSERHDAVVADGIGVVVLVNRSKGSKVPLTDSVRSAIAAVEGAG